MPIITINTVTQPSGISYAWDRDYDLKTPEEVRTFYAKHKDIYKNKLRFVKKLEEMLVKIELLAAKDGIDLEPNKAQHKKKK